MIWNVTLYLLYMIQVSILVSNKRRFHDKNGIIWLPKAHKNVS